MAGGGPVGRVMDGTLALAIAMTNHGNEYLSGKMSTPPELPARNTTFQYVDTITFPEEAVPDRLASLEREAAKTELGRSENLSTQGPTATWFLKLKRRRASRLELNKVSAPSELPERIRTAFAGGVDWVIQVSYPDALEVWIPRWTHQGGRLWTIRCAGEFTHEPLSRWWPPIEQASASLEKAVRAAADLCERGHEEWFAQRFRESLSLLESKDREAPYHPDMVADDFPAPSARPLLAAAVRAWLFGGMGSFNDVGFQDLALDDAYGRIADELYKSVLDAIFSSVNSR